MSKAWCTCGDELYSCDEYGEGAFQFRQLKYIDINNPKGWYYCFGCDMFFRLKPVNPRPDTKDSQNTGSGKQ